MKTDLHYSPWDITETSLNRDNNYRNETIFSLGNGYLGTRGTFEEHYNFSENEGMEGNFINGFYESEPIRYGEFNYGFPRKSQSMLNVTNAKIIRLFIDDEEFHMFHGKITEYRRNLSLKEGLLERSCIWETKTGKRIQITIKRLVSFTHSHLLSILYQIKPLNFSGSVQIISQIETDICNHTSATNPLIDYGPYGTSLLLDETEVSDSSLTTISHVKNNGFYLFTGCCHSFDRHTVINTTVWDTKAPNPGITYTLEVVQGQTSSMTKQIIYDTHTSDREQCKNAGIQLLQESAAFSFPELAEQQKKFLEQFWEKADIIIDGDSSVQQGLHFNLFHILQATGRDGLTSIGAKGLSGEGYEGHVFWDTEMYIIPFYTHTYPELAKNLLLYRYHCLDAARQHARELGHKAGALYPWRTINGNEASAYYPLGSAQYHINSDIAYALNQYGQITGDNNFMYDYGLEILCEISKVIAEVGHFSPYKDNQYVISCVTGPDEYNAIVDNNFYTNLGARETLKYTLYWLDSFKNNQEESYYSFINKMNLTDSDFMLWKKIIGNMYLGYDSNLDIYIQDDTFLQKKPWDAETDSDKKKSLLYVNFHPLYVFRHQMCKQADTPLALLLFNHLFSKEELRKNYEFYYPKTIHHSSLSQCIYAIIESRLGKHESAYQNFITSARMDLDDYHNNVYAGIHGANMAGTWMILTYGIAGMNTTDGKLHFCPYLPDTWKSYSFKIKYHGSALKITVTKEQCTYELIHGESITFSHNGEEFILTHNAPLCALSY